MQNTLAYDLLTLLRDRVAFFADKTKFGMDSDI